MKRLLHISDGAKQLVDPYFILHFAGREVQLSLLLLLLLTTQLSAVLRQICNQKSIVSGRIENHVFQRPPALGAAPLLGIPVSIRLREHKTHLEGLVRTEFLVSVYFAIVMAS